MENNLMLEYSHLLLSLNNVFRLSLSALSLTLSWWQNCTHIDGAKSTEKLQDYICRCFTKNYLLYFPAETYFLI